MALRAQGFMVSEFQLVRFTDGMLEEMECIRACRVLR